MMTAEACDLIVDLVRQLSIARDEAATWRTIALLVIRDEAERVRIYEMVSGRIMRRYVEAQRRQTEAA